VPEADHEIVQPLELDSPLPSALLQVLAAVPLLDPLDEVFNQVSVELPSEVPELL
jgi:hypothetical protein